jgi:hypothetical protein
LKELSVQELLRKAARKNQQSKDVVNITNLVKKQKIAYKTQEQKREILTGHFRRKIVQL